MSQWQWMTHRYHLASTYFQKITNAPSNGIKYCSYDFYNKANYEIISKDFSLSCGSPLYLKAIWNNILASSGDVQNLLSNNEYSIYDILNILNLPYSCYWQATNDSSFDIYTVSPAYNYLFLNECISDGFIDNELFFTISGWFSHPSGIYATISESGIPNVFYEKINFFIKVSSSNTNFSDIRNKIISIIGDDIVDNRLSNNNIYQGIGLNDYILSLTNLVVSNDFILNDNSYGNTFDFIFNNISQDNISYNSYTPWLPKWLMKSNDYYKIENDGIRNKAIEVLKTLLYRIRINNNFILYGYFDAIYIDSNNTYLSFIAPYTFNDENVYENVVVLIRAKGNDYTKISGIAYLDSGPSNTTQTCLEYIPGNIETLEIGLPLFLKNMYIFPLSDTLYDLSDKIYTYKFPYIEYTHDDFTTKEYIPNDLDVMKKRMGEEHKDLPIQYNYIEPVLEYISLKTNRNIQPLQLTNQYRERDKDTNITNLNISSLKPTNYLISGIYNGWLYVLYKNPPSGFTNDLTIESNNEANKYKMTGDIQVIGTSGIYFINDEENVFYNIVWYPTGNRIFLGRPFYNFDIITDINEIQDVNSNPLSYQTHFWLFDETVVVSPFPENSQYKYRENRLWQNIVPISNSNFTPVNLYINNNEQKTFYAIDLSAPNYFSFVDNNGNIKQPEQSNNGYSDEYRFSKKDGSINDSHPLYNQIYDIRNAYDNNPLNNIKINAYFLCGRKIKLCNQTYVLTEQGYIPYSYHTYNGYTYYTTDGYNTSPNSSIIIDTLNFLLSRNISYVVFKDNTSKVIPVFSIPKINTIILNTQISDTVLSNYFNREYVTYQPSHIVFSIWKMNNKIEYSASSMLQKLYDTETIDNYTQPFIESSDSSFARYLKYCNNVLLSGINISNYNIISYNNFNKDKAVIIANNDGYTIEKGQRYFFSIFYSIYPWKAYPILWGIDENGVFSEFIKNVNKYSFTYLNVDDNNINIYEGESGIDYEGVYFSTTKNILNIHELNEYKISCNITNTVSSYVSIYINNSTETMKKYIFYGSYTIGTVPYDFLTILQNIYREYGINGTDVKLMLDIVVVGNDSLYHGKTIEITLTSNVEGTLLFESNILATSSDTSRKIIKTDIKDIKVIKKIYSNSGKVIKKVYSSEPIQSTSFTYVENDDLPYLKFAIIYNDKKVYISPMNINKQSEQLPQVVFFCNKDMDNDIKEYIKYVYGENSVIETDSAVYSFDFVIELTSKYSNTYSPTLDISKLNILIYKDIYRFI